MEIKITEITAEQTYDIRHRIMWPNKPLEFIILEEDQDGIHFGLWKGKILVTVVSLFINGNKAQFRKLATETSEQGKGYAAQLINHLVTIAIEKKISTLWCNARLAKSAYYEKFCLKKTSKTYIKGGIDFVVMERIIGE